MTEFEKLKEYRELSGLTKVDVKKLGNYPKTEQYYGQVENGIWPNVDEESLKECYTAINVARYAKQQAAQNEVRAK